MGQSVFRRCCQRGWGCECLSHREHRRERCTHHHPHDSHTHSEQVSKDSSWVLERVEQPLHLQVDFLQCWGISEFLSSEDDKKWVTVRQMQTSRKRARLGQPSSVIGFSFKDKDVSWLGTDVKKLKSGSRSESSRSHCERSSNFREEKRILPASVAMNWLSCWKQSSAKTHFVIRRVSILCRFAIASRMMANEFWTNVRFERCTSVNSFFVAKPIAADRATESFYETKWQWRIR